MTSVPNPPGRAATGDLARRLGQLSTASLGLVLVAWALTVDYPKLSPGFFADGATYYSLGHSLAEDFDFEYRREDLVRVWREFPGPEGIFLKRGRDVKGIDVSRTFPFFHLVTAPDWDSGRLYYGKGFIYPLLAAPWVWLAGTNGFLLFHALLMTACFACAYGFLVARSAPLAALLFAVAFLLVSVAPVYMVWIQPDFFNLAVTLIAYFFWAYKEVAAGTSAPIERWRARWVMTPRSDLIAAVLLGVVTFSKPTNVFLIGPIVGLLAWRGHWRRSLAAGAVFGAVVAGLFALNVGITGEWNYQGGEDRGTFYSLDPDGAPGPRIGGFPFQTERHTFESTGMPRETNRVPVEVLTGRDALFEVFRRNLGYFFFGRHTGFVPYFFPGAVAIVLFLWNARQRAAWQWLALAAGLGSALVLILYMPYSYSGGGGPVGNRYFLGIYPAFLFVLPPLARVGPGLVALAGSAVFTAQLVTNPFFVSYNPSQHVKSGPYRVLPAELTLLNDLPMNVTPSKVKQPLGGVPPVLAYFLDDNAYRPEQDAFWVRGESRAEMFLRAPIVTAVDRGVDAVRALTIRRMDVHLETGPEPNQVTIRTGAETQTVEIPANDRRSITVAMGPGLPYRPDPSFPMNYVYAMAIASQSGFVPMFRIGSGDTRYLGVFVRLVPVYE